MTPIDAPLLHQYQNGDYLVRLYADGSKVRTWEDNPSPFVPMPEQMDLKITNWCDAGCGWCHEQSTTSGAHANLRRTAERLKGLHAGTEIAIGGGDPLSHPEFEPFVREIRSYGLVPSVTINGRHFARSLPTLERLIVDKCLFGVGLSIYNKIEDWDYPHLIHHAIAGITPPQLLTQAKHGVKLLVLGYKNFGRGSRIVQLQHDLVHQNKAMWYRLLPLIARKHQVSFDNLAIEQLRPQRLFSDQAQFQTRYMGPEGLFSMYVDAVTETYALCSYSPDKKPWNDMTLPEMFQDVRTTAHPQLFDR